MGHERHVQCHQLDADVAFFHEDEEQKDDQNNSGSNNHSNTSINNKKDDNGDERGFLAENMMCRDYGEDPCIFSNMRNSLSHSTRQNTLVLRLRTSGQTTLDARSCTGN
jgi:hypothetical protein